MEEKTVYSYHTFLYPFLWNDIDGNHSIDVFETKLKLESAGWSQDDMVSKKNGEINLTSVVNNESQDEQRLDYQTFQYFNPAARKALFREDGEIVHGWKYRSGDVHNKAEYKIFEKGSDNPYVLNINHIRLRLFNTGVGILVFELEYPMPNEGVKKARQDIRAINELGRRVFPEFLPEQPEIFMGSLFATRIEIVVDENHFEENLYCRSGLHGEQSYLRDPLHKQSFLFTLLGYDSNSTISITPAVDDRMFVCCCIMDPDYTEHFLYRSYQDPSLEKTELSEEEKKFSMQNKQPMFLDNWDVGTELYALTNIDYKDSSCQNRVMLNQYFEDQLYLRWTEIGYSTIYSVTNHSMICLTGDRKYVTAPVVNPFLIEYIQLCILVLAQRASLIAFDSRITEAISRDDEKEIITDKLLTLSKDFAKFQGQILIPEATPQIQGIELYGKLQRMLFIEKLQNNVLSQMSSLSGMAQYEQERRQQKMDKDLEEQQFKTGLFFNVIAAVTIVSVLIDFFNYIVWFVSPHDDICLPSWWIMMIIDVILILTVAGRSISLIHDKKKKEKEKDE